MVGRLLKKTFYIGSTFIGLSFLQAAVPGDSTGSAAHPSSAIACQYMRLSEHRAAIPSLYSLEIRRLSLSRISTPAPARALDIAADERSGSANDPAEESSSNSLLKPVLFVGSALAITGVLIKTDQQTYQALYDWKQSHTAIKDVSPVITNLGDGRASMLIFGGFLAYSYIDDDRTALQAGKIGLESFFLSGIVAQILKHTFGRERPSNASVSGGRWNGAFLLLNQGSGKRGGYAQYDAFPSGHTTSIFAAATTLSEIYGDSPWVSYASYSVASVVAVSRVTEQAHWISDCFVGGLIGYFSTQLVLHLNHSGKPVALLPVTDGRQMGLALNVGF